jgi:hypothetical protein
LIIRAVIPDRCENACGQKRALLNVYLVFPCRLVEQYEFIVLGNGMSILQQIARQADRGGTYLLTDTDSMLIVASRKGGKVPCACPGNKREIKALKWMDIVDFCSKLNRLNPYDRSTVQKILKIEKSNYDHKGKQQQLYGMAVSAKRYVVYAWVSEEERDRHGQAD